MKTHAATTIGEPPMRWLALALSILLLPHVLNQPTWVIALPLLAISWRYLGITRNFPQPGRWLLTLLAILATVAVMSTYGTLLGRDAGIALLLLMTGFKVLETRSRRDAMLSVFLGYFVIITHFLYSQEIPVVVYLVVAMIVTTMALIRINTSGPPPPLREHAGLAGLMLLQALPIMLILFLLFPRLPGPLWGLPQQQDRATTGLSNSMSPGSISELLLSDGPALRARFPEGPPPPAQRYWRGPVFSAYDGRTWRAQPQFSFLPETNTMAPIPGREVRYTVMLQPHNQHWLLALDPPTSVPDGALINPDYVLSATRRLQRVETYELTSASGARLELELTPERRRLTLQLPDDVSPRARALAADWAAEHGDASGIVNTALDFFNREPFRYTLSPPLLTGDPVDEFLFETRAGFCEHYAGSFTVLMRAAGIPARVVTGYQGGQWNRAGGYLLVRQADAHAWAEVWLDGQGWIRVDPTGSVAPERIELGIRAALENEEDLPNFLRREVTLSGLAALQLQWEYLRDITGYYWDDWVLGFGPERQRELLARLGLGSLDSRGTVLLMVGLLALVGALFALAFLWRNRRPQRDPLARLYGRFTKRMAHLGLAPLPHEGPRSFTHRVARERPDLHDTVAAFTRTYEALRYGREPDPDLFRDLRVQLRAIH